MATVLKLRILIKRYELLFQHVIGCLNRNVGRTAHRLRVSAVQSEACKHRGCSRALAESYILAAVQVSGVKISKGSMFNLTRARSFRRNHCFIKKKQQKNKTKQNKKEQKKNRTLIPFFYFPF